MMKRGFTLIELLIVIAIIAILALIAIPNFIEAQTRAKVTRAMSDLRSISTAIEAYFVDYNSYPLVDTRPNALTRTSPPYKAFAHHLWERTRGSYASPDGLCTALTTPVGYFSSTLPPDPFYRQEKDGAGEPRVGVSYFYYNFLAANHFLGKPASCPTPIRFNAGGSEFGVPEETWSKAPVHYCYWAMFSYGPDGSPYSGQAPDGANIDCRNFLFYARQDRWRNEGTTSTYDPTNGTVSVGMIWRLQGSTPE